MAGRNSITLKGEFLRKEAAATVTIRPGMLIGWDALITSVKPTTSIGGVEPAGSVRKAFALENDLIGRGIDDYYAVGDQVQYGVFHRGAEIQALLKTGNTTVIGSPLMSAGAGNLQLVGVSLGTNDEEIVAYAMEVVANATGADARIRVEVA